MQIGAKKCFHMNLTITLITGHLFVKNVHRANLCLCNGFLLCLFFPVGVQPSAMWLAIWRSYASLFVVLKWHRGIVQEYCLGMVSAGSGSSGRCSVVRCLRSPPLVRHTKPHSPHSNPSPETLLLTRAWWIIFSFWFSTDVWPYNIIQMTKYILPYTLALGLHDKQTMSTVTLVFLFKNRWLYRCSITKESIHNNHKVYHNIN